MSSFTKFNSELHISYSKRASDVLGRDYWVVRESFVYYIGAMDSNKFVIVPKGFLTDGATVPWLLRLLVPRMGRLSQAAVLHDYLTETYYVKDVSSQGIRNLPITRKKIDEIFYEALRVLEVPKIQIVTIRLGLSIFRFFRRPTQPKDNRMKKHLEEQFAKQLGG